MDIFVRKGEPTPDLLSTCNTLYFEDPHLSYHYSHTGMRVRLLDNAFKPGAVVRCYYVESRFNNPVATYNHISRELGGDVRPETIAQYLSTLSFAAGRYGFEPIDVSDEVRLHYSEGNGTNTFSPFALDRLKPLREVPAKWTMAHAKRALANHQFRNLRCNGVYSDDYAYDAAVDFHRGPVDHLVMLEKLVESPSGWWTSLDGNGSVSLCCHHFDSNSFQLEMQPY
ncbi:hypothetical protein [Noviherbaspirillum galbum]|uniref:Uncharacterized protein n=1 Tax=Noviherbaspirillum galbum TaxID=2709383 RepID=A0A6B3SGU2_9BURK|nr:hypothetical protein [Noviherbaspirillum galbum]NEX60097.1 hypothetical protein [Noviherbaspirillum galbum]